MRIATPPLDAAFCEAELHDLEELAAQPDARQARPCPGCALACARCGSKVCTCNCRPDCPEAPRRLSSDPERFPVEAGIVPLVYAFAGLRLLPTCWSCEGHDDGQGGLRRPPSLWFFSRKLAYPGLLTAVLSRLAHDRRLRHDWQVVALNCGVESDWVFALEPRPAAERPLHLESLRGDVATIAGQLGRGMRELAAARGARLRRMLAAHR